MRFGSGKEGSGEKTIFIPKEKIISADLLRETRWWKKLLKPALPNLAIRYRGPAGHEDQTVLLQVDIELFSKPLPGTKLRFDEKSFKEELTSVCTNCD
jgi:hypothetical protein